MITETASANFEISGIGGFFEPARAQRLLREVWPLGEGAAVEPSDLRIERYWPMSGSRLTMEWSFQLGTTARHSLYVVMGGDSDGGSVEEFGPHSAAGPPITTAGKLQGVRIQLPVHNGLIHSPDQDPRMPHLATCLDAGEMADRLPMVSGSERDAGPSNGMSPCCRLLGYRAGRRAAIHYSFRGSNGPSSALLGKAFRDERGKRLLERHARLRKEPALTDGDRIQIAEPIGYDADLRMAFFSWAPGQSVDQEPRSLSKFVQAAANVLSLLHAVPVEGLDEFAPADECGILLRWHDLVRRIDGGKARAAESLIDGLLRIADSLEEEDAATIHRDFYEKQLLVSGNRVTLLDLDTLAHGSPCVDLGNVLAHLLLSVLHHGGGAMEFEPLAHLFLQRYTRNAGRINDRLLTFYFCSALFRLGAVHAFRTKTGRCAGALWRFATEQLSNRGIGIQLGQGGVSGQTTSNIMGGIPKREQP